MRERLPNGAAMNMHVVRLNGGAVIIPVHGSKLVLERQYRPAIGRWLYELPAGLIEKGEEPIEAARRELKEETGFTAASIEHAFSSYSSPGLSDEIVHFFIARGLRKGKRHLEKHEIIETRDIESGYSKSR